MRGTSLGDVDLRTRLQTAWASVTDAVPGTNRHRKPEAAGVVLALGNGIALRST